MTFIDWKEEQMSPGEEKEWYEALAKHAFPNRHLEVTIKENPLDQVVTVQDPVHNETLLVMCHRHAKDVYPQIISMLFMWNQRDAGE